MLAAYQDDALPVAERLDFERHVAVCPACRGYLSQMRAVIGTAGATGTPELSPADEEALLAAFRALGRGHG
jgi:anti-sigma factor RsiW